MIRTSSAIRLRALSGASALSLAMALSSGVATAQASETVEIDIAQQPLDHALLLYSDQTDTTIVVEAALTQGKFAPSVRGTMSADEALTRLLEGSGLALAKSENGRVTIAQAGENDDPQPLTVLAQAETGTSTGRSREKIIVTGQKREEYIQDVPIAISAFSQEDLTTSQIAGGPDLITQIPNFTFTKTNFSGYSIQIRGIGTQAISATTDPAVAVAFNNTPFTRNRFFEQEFYDMERVEVLRGPQGTLYGRNATAGVVNLISAKPTFEDELRLSIDRGNYNSRRLEGMANIPLVEDQVALRIAGAATRRDGYAENELTDSSIDGRDLWSTRVSLRFAPTDRIDANLIWEHFQENDDRLRSGKQLCKKDVVTDVAGFPITSYLQTLPETGQSAVFSGVQATFSQGCQRASLYSPDSFQTPTGLMLPYYRPLGAVGLPTALDDPYVSQVQSQDLRVIESTIDPIYRANADIGQFQISFEMADGLTLESETAYSTDSVYSLQDFNRFNTAPGAWRQPESGDREGVLLPGDAGGIFCDPQLGCSDRLIAVDISTAEATQFSQEFRLSSAYSGPFNFNLGANFLRGDSEDKYYVFINSISLIAAKGPVLNSYPPYVPGETDNSVCLLNGYSQGDPDEAYPVVGCTYIDPNPIGQVNDQGHNYFLSRNPFKLISYAAFGEAYWNVTDTLKVTAGLRYTVDKKDAPRIPTWILATNTVGYPVAETIEQEWREPTGRLTIDWKPDLGFTDDSLLYFSYAHGYKAGGANPPGFVRTFYANGEVARQNSAASATRPRTFEPEFVEAFEFGAKNTFLGGDATINLAGFYYDYTGYQVSEIVDRSAFNRNFDAEIWGAEIEAEWWALENLRLSLKGGYEKTRIADGQEAIDLMDRTAGDPNWTLRRPFPTFASSCILPTWLFVGNTGSNPANPELVNVGGVGGGNPSGCEYAYVLGLDPVTNDAYVAAPPPSSLPFTHAGVINYSLFDPMMSDGPYPGWNPETAPNNGEGIAKPLGGNELPNAPNYTATISADYILPLGSDWTLTFHTDLHYQSESWWRVFQDHEFSRLNEYYTMNLAAILRSEGGWNIMGYVKNVTDETAITGAFLNSDDTGLTTNVFLTEPRLYGVRITKDWTGGTFLGGLVGRAPRDPSAPYPLTLTLGGQIQRWDAPNEVLGASFGPAFAPPIDIFDDVQNEDLEWGDGRDVKLTYRMPNSPWSISGGVRYGKTGSTNRGGAEQAIEPVCVFGGFMAAYCPIFADDPKYGRYTYLSQDNHAYEDVYDYEEYTFEDFAIGRDVGIGGLSRSTFAAALRYAQFTSRTSASMRGVPDWDIPEGLLTYSSYATHTVYNGRIEAEREFEGLGAEFSWTAARRLLGDADVGELGLEWSLSGGVLVGDQRATITGEEEETYFETVFFSLVGAFDTPSAMPTELPAIAYSRSNDVTAPFAGASLGLSYNVDRFTIGAGYRWERYYDVIDGGMAEREQVDRTIDGPYLNVSIGFGG